jgi:large subunit ribosomal protein L23
MNLYDIIKRPKVTEKSVHQQNSTNTYTFEVDRRANKIEIRKAVESLFKVKVSSVRTITMPSKLVRRGKTVGATSPWKKALVTVADGQKIEGV